MHMKHLPALATAVIALGLILTAGVASAADPAKPRVVVMTDIGNEPDDSESMVRFLLYSNEFDVEGLLAVTSTWLRTAVHPELIEERVRAYGKVVPNLRVHAAGYPDEQYLLDRIKAGRSEYGMKGVGAGKDTEASRLIIAAVDRFDARPVWFTLWGGATDLAQALWTVKSTRSPEEVSRFVAKLRVYSISDQDDAAPWIRATFPCIFWIVSVHAFGQYRLATWLGISANLPGADPAVISREWLDAHIRRGPLGALYPYPLYLMEGDTPSFLYLIPNGLGSPEHPDWGSWGGRYGSLAPSVGLWTDSVDTVVGSDGHVQSSNQASVWRWRDDFQNDFAARMAWTLTDQYAPANHNPRVVLNGVPGRGVVLLTACAGAVVHLSAGGTGDPDGNALKYHWSQYREASGGVNPQVVPLSGVDSPDAQVVAPIATKPAPNVDIPAKSVFHILLKVTDDGAPPLSSYRRAVLTVPAPGTTEVQRLHCRAPSGK